MRRNVFDTGPLLELIVDEYAGPGENVLKPLQKLGPPLLEAVRTELRSSSERLTTGGVISELDHHGEALKGQGFGEFQSFVLAWLRREKVGVVDAPTAGWGDECARLFGLTDAGVVALGQQTGSRLIVLDGPLYGWVRYNTPVAVCTVYELDAPTR